MSDITGRSRESLLKTVLPQSSNKGEKNMYNQAEYLNKVLKMVEDSISKPLLYPCFLCEGEFTAKELTDIEFRLRDIMVCDHCLINLPDEYPEDEDQFRGDR